MRLVWCCQRRLFVPSQFARFAPKVGKHPAVATFQLPQPFQLVEYQMCGVVGLILQRNHHSNRSTHRSGALQTGWTCCCGHFPRVSNLRLRTFDTLVTGMARPAKKLPQLEVCRPWGESCKLRRNKKPLLATPDQPHSSTPLSIMMMMMIMMMII